MTTEFNLSAGATLAMPAVTLGQGWPTEVNGLPAFYFWRQSIRDGTYRHPTAGFELHIDHARRRKLEETFRRMKQNGVAVPVVLDHDESADKCRGYVVDVRQNGQWLEELHQYLGPDARDTALRNQVSLGIATNFKDGEGREYGEAIRHSALTPVPVVPGQGNAVGIAASSGQRSPAIEFILAADTHSKGGTRVPIEINEQQFARFKELLGGGDDVTAETVVAKLADRLTGAADLDRKLSDAQAQITTLSAAAPRKTDPEILADRADLAAQKVAMKLDAGKITKAQHDRLLSMLGAGTATPAEWLLSRQTGGKQAIDAFLEVLDLNTPLAGVRTGVQTLARSTPDGDDAKDGDPGFVKSRVQAIGGGK